MVYSITAGLTFIYGLVISGYLIDKGGVKLSLVIGSFFLACARFLMTFATEKWVVFLTFTTLIPLGMSLCKFKVTIIEVFRCTCDDISYKTSNTR